MPFEMPVLEAALNFVRFLPRIYPNLAVKFPIFRKFDSSVLQAFQRKCL